MRKTVPASIKQSSQSPDSVISDSVINKHTSAHVESAYHDVSPSTRHSPQPGGGEHCNNRGLLGGQRSGKSKNVVVPTVDKHLSNNLSPDLSTALGDDVHTRESGNARGNTALQQCVAAELEKYFAMLEGHPPNDLYKLVITQVEAALFGYVLEACGNNQSRAAEYLGVSRGTLRNRIVDLSLD